MRHDVKLKIKLILWKKREHGQELHNRYLLTEAFVVAFGTGLDQNNKRSPYVTHDLHLLDGAKLSAHCREYLGSLAAFDLAAKAFLIQA